MNINKTALSLVLVGALGLSGLPALAKDDAPAGPILFTNVDVFDGENLEL